VGGIPAPGTGGSITTQGGIDINVAVWAHELATRRNNAGRSNLKTYPGGGSEENLNVAKGDPVLGYRQTSTGQRQMGQAQIAGFSSLNGINWGPYEEVENLENQLFFIGQSKTDYKPLSGNEILNGIAVLAFGSCTLRYTGMKAAYPGDLMVWRLPFFHTNSSEYRPDAHTGKSKTKLTAIIEPLDWRELYCQQSLTYGIMVRNSDEGVLRVPIDQLGKPGHALTRRREAALAMKKRDLCTGLATVQQLEILGLATVLTPERKLRQQLYFDIARTVMTALGGELNDVVVTAPTGAGPVVDIRAQVNALLSRYTPEKTDPGAEPRPSGMKFFRFDPTLGQSVAGPEFTAHYDYFAEGLNFAVDLSSKEGGPPATLTDMEYVSQKLAERDRSLLWLAGVMGVVGGKSLVKDRVVYDILNGIYPLYSAHEHKIRYDPPFRRNDAMAMSSSNKLKREYIKCLRDAPAQGEIAAALHRWGVTSRVIGTATSPAVPGLDQPVDLVLGGRVAV
jgi:hypothetical protein